MRISMLASGSGGNCLFMEAEGTRLLVEAGLPMRELLKRLAHVPDAPSPERMDGLLLTHEHSDHAGHAHALVERGLRPYATAGTIGALGLPDFAARLEPGQRATVGAFEVLPVPVPHDAAEPVGFVLEAEGSRVGVLLDCGHATPALCEAFSGCDVLVLEANHDPEMLRYGAYPASLKRRIGGRRGHLSNAQAAELLRGLAVLPRCVVLAHLSPMNNRPQLARAAVARVIGRRPVRLLVASQARVLAPITIEREAIRIAGGLPGEQLSLPLFDARA
jgi:phosphoribosyl 1,2-cyclic phosphodiesterase